MTRGKKEGKRDTDWGEDGSQMDALWRGLGCDLMCKSQILCIVFLDLATTVPSSFLVSMVINNYYTMYSLNKTWPIPNWKKQKVHPYFLRLDGMFGRIKNPPKKPPKRQTDRYSPILILRIPRHLDDSHTPVCTWPHQGISYHSALIRHTLIPGLVGQLVGQAGGQAGVRASQESESLYIHYSPFFLFSQVHPPPSPSPSFPTRPGRLVCMCGCTKNNVSWQRVCVQKKNAYHLCMSLTRTDLPDVCV